MATRSRQRRSYFWLGTQGTAVVTTAATTAIDLYDAASASLADSKSLRLETCVVWLGAYSGDASNRVIAFGIQHVPTSEGLTSVNIINPASTDIDYFNKKQLVYGGRLIAPGSGFSPLAVNFRVRSRRNIDAAQDAVVASFRAEGASCTIQYWFRTLYSKPA